MQFLLHSPMRILYQSMQNRLDIYDKKNKSNLKKMIVDCCLEYKMNLKEMAKAEFIHYNTVQYRMKKIEELLQINLKRPSDMDTLYTLALFMKMKEKWIKCKKTNHNLVCFFYKIWFAFLFFWQLFQNYGFV